MRAIYFAAAFMAVASSSSAQEKQRPVTWQQSPVIIMPGQIAAGEAGFAKSQDVLSIPLRWLVSGRLSQAVTIGEGKNEVRFEPEELLPLTRIGGTRGYALRMAYCSRSRVAEAKENSGFLGAMLGSMANSLQDKQVCLEDSDDDGKVDRALVVGDGPGIVELGTIEPVAIEKLAGEIIGGEQDQVSLSLGTVGRKDVRLDLNLMQQGNTRNFQTWQSGPYVANRYNNVRYNGNKAGPQTILGIRFEVVQADDASDTATLRWTNTLNEGAIVVVPDEVVTSYY